MKKTTPRTTGEIAASPVAMEINIVVLVRPVNSSEKTNKKTEKSLPVNPQILYKILAFLEKMSPYISRLASYWNR